MPTLNFKPSNFRIEKMIELFLTFGGPRASCVRVGSKLVKIGAVARAFLGARDKVLYVKMVEV